MKSHKRMAIIIAVCSVAAAAIAAFIFVQIKDLTYFHSPPYAPEPVYHSLSGNTEAIAREVARKFNADIVKIEAPKYSLDFKGWRNAGSGTDDKMTMVKITPGKSAKSVYKRVKNRRTMPTTASCSLRRSISRIRSVIESATISLS